MDTPAHPNRAPRRKLKRVLKKNKASSGFSLNNSSHSLYQKKIKNAINTSLNVTTNVRTLQANNRSLALQREKLRQDLRDVVNEHMNLLQQNHNLSKRVLELERQLDMAPSIIEHEVNSRCQDKFKAMQTQLDLLLENASTFTNSLAQLRQHCKASPRKSGNTASSLSFRLSTCSSDGTDIPNLTRRSPASPLATHGSFTDMNEDNSERIQKSPGLSDRGFVQDMSMIMESSHLEDRLISTEVPLTQVPEDLPEEDEIASQSPSSVALCLPQPNILSRLEAGDSDGASLGQLDREETLVSPMTRLRRSERRNPLLVSKGGSPLRRDQRILQVDSMHMYSDQTSGEGQSKAAGETASVVSSPAEYFNGMSARENLKKHKNNSNQDVGKSSSLKSRRNADVIKSPPLFIRNAFELMSAHKEWLEKKEDSPAKKTEVTSQTPESPCGENTCHVVKDMELTTGVFDTPATQKTNHGDQNDPTSPKNLFRCESLVAASPTKINTSEPKVLSDDEPVKRKSTKESLPAQGSSRSRHGSSSSGQDTGSDPEAASVPGAVTMRVSRGGKLVFAVSRKGADGSRAVVQASIRARSKPKKVQKVDLEQTFVTESGQDVQNIFDFHDKTPKSLQQNQHQTSMSVFSLSADESALSPLGPFKQLRESNIDKGKGKTADVSNALPQPDIDKTAPTSSPQVERFQSRSKSISRSRSRSRKKHFEEQDKDAKNLQKLDAEESNEILLSDIAKTAPKSKSSPVVEKSNSRSKSIARSRSRSRKKRFEEDDKEDMDVEHGMQKDQDLDIPGLPQPSQFDNPANAPVLPVLDIASTFVGEVYMEPLKGSPEVRPRYRTRSQSRGRRGKSTDRQSPESARKIRPKSAGSSEQDRGRQRGRDRMPKTPGVKITTAQDASPDIDVLPLQEVQITDEKSVDHRVTKGGSPFNEGRVEVSARKSRPAVRNSRGRSRSHIDCDKSQSPMKDLKEVAGASCKDREASDGNSEVRSSVVEKQMGSNSKKFEERKSGERGIDSSWPKDDLDKTKSPMKIGSPSHMSRKDFATALSKSENKKGGRPAVECSRADSIRNNNEEEMKLIEQDGEANIKRRLPRSRGKGIHKNKAEATATSSSPGSRLERGADPQERQRPTFSFKEGDKVVAGSSPQKISMRSRARQYQAVPSSTQGKECQLDSIHLPTKGKRDHNVETEDSSNTSPSPKNGARMSNTAIQGAKPQAQQDNFDKHMEVVYQSDRNDKQSYLSPDRQTNSKQSQKKSKHIIIFNQKVMEGSEGQNNPAQEDLESGKSLRYSDGQESQKSNTHRSGLDYDPEGRVMASKGAEQGKNKDFMKSTLAVLSHNTAVSPDTAMGRDQNEQKEAQLAGTSSSTSYKGPKYSKIVKNSRNLFNFSTDPESLSPNREGRKRRAASNVNYVEPPLSGKLRRGDPFTSHYSSEKLSIYRSPRSKAKEKTKEKARLRRDILGSLHNLAIKGGSTSAKTEQD